MASTPLQLSTLNFWKTFDLPKFQKELDQIALDIANRQDESDISRQKLVEQSREFKKNSPEDVKKCVAPLFKNFQQEIDSLSKRSKAAEAAFLSVYKQIIDFVDPSTLIEQFEKLQKISQKIKDLEVENKQLRETLLDNNRELAQAKYCEELCKKLELKLKDTEKNIQTLTDASVNKIQEEMAKSFTDRETQLLTEKESLNDTIERLKCEINNLRGSFDSINAQLFELKNKYDEDMLAKNSEIDLLANDIENLTHKVEASEMENRNLKVGQGNGKTFDDNERIAEFNNEINSLRSQMDRELDLKDIEITRLMGEMKDYKDNFIDLERDTGSKIAQLQEEIMLKAKALEILEERLSSMGDYHIMKRELNILKSMEFNEQQVDSNISPNTEKEKSLEMLVMEKNKAIKHENASLKISNAQINEKYDRISNDNIEKEKLLSERNSLIEKLEKDLLALESMTIGYRGDGEGQPASPSSTEVLKSATSQIGYPKYSSMESITSNNADSLLPIVSSQRERFKTRNKELEGENADLKKKLHVTKLELDQYKNDNLMLYEKIRFMQSYSNTTSSSLASQRNLLLQGADPSAYVNLRERSMSPRSSKRSQVETTYADRYESRLDPFRDFNMKEKQRKLNNLNPPEKMIYFMATRMVSNRTARIFAFIYMIILHCLVFMVLYQLAKIENCHREASVDWAAKYSDHMKEAHKDSHHK